MATARPAARIRPLLVLLVLLVLSLLARCLRASPAPAPSASPSSSAEPDVEVLPVTLNRPAYAHRVPDGVIYDPLAGLQREEWHWRDDPSDDAPLRVVRTPGDREDSDEDLLRIMGVHVPGDDLLDAPLTRQVRHLNVTERQSENTVRVAGTQSTLQVTYTGSTPAEARRPFENSLKIWADTFPCEVVIRIQFEWKEISSSTLAATTNPFFIPGSRRGANNLDDNTVYGSVMAASLEGRDFIGANDFHIVMTFNSRAKWHFGDDNTPLRKWDLATTALHEQCHGLFFSGVVQVNTGQQVAGFSSNRGYPGRFDRFLAASDTSSLAEVCNRNATNFYNAITNSGLRFTDPQTPGTDFGLYSPGDYQTGSSTYHNDPARLAQDCQNNEIPRSDCSDLMTQRLPNGYTQRNVGEPVRRIMAAMRGSSPGVGNGGTCVVPAGTPGQSAGGTSSGGRSGGTFGEDFSLPRWAFWTAVGVGIVGAVGIAYALISSVFRSR